MSEAAEDAERFGLPAEIAEQLGKEEAGFALWPENTHIVDAFLAVSTQWRAFPLPTGRIHWQGLDYAAARAGLKAADIALSPASWARLQIMEREAASALNGYRG